jgi:hypothetical protein
VESDGGRARSAAGEENLAFLGTSTEAYLVREEQTCWRFAGVVYRAAKAMVQVPVYRLSVVATATHRHL